MGELPTEAVTFLFTDIEGSTALWERYPDAMRAALDRHDALLREAIEQHGGAIFKTVGDAFHAVFARPLAALAAAVAAQRAFRSTDWPEVGSLRVRMALHTGPAEERDGDYFGPPLNRTARLVGLAHGGQVLVSGAARDLLRGALPGGLALRDLGEHRLRDLAQPERIFQVVAPELAADFPPLKTAEALGAEAARPVSPTVAGSERPARPALQVYLLGRFQVVVDGQPVPDDAWRRKKARQLFKCLLTRPRRRLAKEEAMELFWPDSDPRAADTNLRTTLLAIRRAVQPPGRAGEEDLVVRDGDVLAIRSNVDIWVDADEFERVVARVRHGRPANAANGTPDSLLEEADALYGGEYLPDDRYEDWAAERRESLKQAWTELQYAVAAQAERRGATDRAVAALQRLLAADPCAERAALELMRLLAGHGRRNEALRVYQRLAQALQDELGVEPDEELMALQRQILVGAPVTRPALPPLEPVAEPALYLCPYPFPEPSELVGRQSELVWLEQALGRGRAAGQIVLIGAPAGTGKSTLLGALIRRAVRSGVLCLAGGCYEQEGVLPLAPFQDALADYLLSRPPDRLRAELGPAAADLARVVPELRYHLDLPEAPDGDVRSDPIRLFGGVHACLRGLAERGPVLLGLEDLHAADVLSLQLLRYLARQTRRLPITIVGTYRPEEAAGPQPLAQILTALVREGAQELRLAPLSRPSTAHLLTALLGREASEPLVETLYSVTEGNPLFLEQLVLALREAGEIEERAGVWQQAHGELQAVPAIVGEVIGRRLNRLSPGCRDLLAMAAVLGRTVPHDALAAALDDDGRAKLTANVEEALGARVLAETSSCYAFTHTLLREVVYRGVSLPRRMQLHARAADALERLAGARAADQAAELAHHLARSEQTPLVRAKALHYSLLAGQQAAALSAYREELLHFTRACELIEHDAAAVDRATRLDALEGRGYAERDLGMWQACIATFRRVLELSDDPLRRGRARGAIAFALQQSGDTTGALAEADAGLRELDAAAQVPEAALPRLRLQFQRAQLSFLEGRSQQLLQLGQQMLHDARALGQPRALFWAHTSVGWAYLGQGRIAQALEQHRLALAAAERAENKVPLALAHSNLGNLLYCGGQLDAARAHLNRAIGLYHDAGTDLRGVITRQTLGRIWLAEGDVARARQQAELALALAKEGRDRWEAECHDLLGTIHTHAADWERAAASFEEALRIRERVGHAAGQVESLVGLGTVQQWRGDWPAALQLYARALDVACTTDPSPQAVAARRHLGRLLGRLGDEAAAQHLERAVALAEDMRESLEFAPTMLAAAELRWRLGDPVGATEYAERALAAAVAVDLAVEARALLVTLYLAADRSGEARSTLADALRRADRLGAPHVLGLAHLAAGRLAAAVGDGPAAAASFEAALRHLTVARTPYERALALGDFARVLATRLGQVERARELLGEAANVLRQLGARPVETQIRALLDELETRTEI